MHKPTIDDRIAELDRVEASYRGNQAQYADLIRNTVSVARLALAELLEERAALEAAHDRALERKDAEIARLRSASTLAQLRAQPEDDDALVRVTFDQPAGGWRTVHLQEAYVRLREAGSDDYDVIDITAANGRARIAGLVADPGHISLTLPDPAPKPLAVDPPQFDEPPDPWLITHGAPVKPVVAAVIITATIALMLAIIFTDLGILA